MVTLMKRTLLFALLLIATPLAAQTEMRAGVRAGIAQYEADGFRVRFDAIAPVFGGDFWMRRGRFALDLGFDGYQIKGADTFTILSADAQFLIGRLAIGGGPAMVTSGDTDFTFIPSLSLNLPAGKRQFVAMVRYHEADLGFENSKTTLFLLGMRTGAF